MAANDNEPPPSRWKLRRLRRQYDRKMALRPRHRRIGLPAGATPPAEPTSLTVAPKPSPAPKLPPAPANDQSALRYATVCSGIEGVSLAFEPLGMAPVFFSEVAPFPKAVLAHHWPDVPDLGDLAQIDGSTWRGKVDVLWGSLPCQSFSSMGQKKGLADPRGALSLTFVKLANQIEPDIIVIENAKDLLNEAHRQDFDALLQALCGPHDRPEGNFGAEGSVGGPHRRAAWRVLDALDFGLPQHRERVFLVATSVASRIDPAGILALGQGSEGHSPSRRQGQSQTAKAGAQGSWFLNGDTRPKVRFEHTATLRAGAHHTFVVQQGSARRLMATEWERLQGIPDEHTLIPWKGGTAPESLRKTAIGNGLAIPVVRWIGQQISEAKGTRKIVPPTNVAIAVPAPVAINDDRKILAGDGYKVHVADCLATLKAMPDRSVSIIMTSPPYNLRGDGRKVGNKGRFESRGDHKGYATYSDNMSHTEYVQWQHDILAECWRVLTEDGVIFYNHMPRIIGRSLRDTLDYIPTHIPILQRLVWLKGASRNHHETQATHAHEDVLVLAKPDFRFRKRGALTSVIDLPFRANVAKESGDHPYPFPEELPSRLIAACPDRLQVVLDPFSGSGTTGAAALKLGRQYIGIELDRGYAEVSQGRLERAIAETVDPKMADAA